MSKNKRCHIGTKIQTLIFDKDKFHGNVMKAKEWLTKHGYKTSVDEKEHTWHFRQEEPTEFKDDSFRTIQLKDGIKAAIACPIHKMAHGGSIGSLSLSDYHHVKLNILSKFVKKSDFEHILNMKINDELMVESADNNYMVFKETEHSYIVAPTYETGGNIGGKTELSKEVKKFVPEKQLRIINTSDEFEEVREDLNRIVASTPKTYETENIKRADKIAYLHYFTGNSDWFILEKDAGSGSDKRQIQAFGYVILNGDWEYAELGYINLEEVKKYAELDLYFEPKLLTEALKGIGGKKVAEDVREAEKEFTLEEVNKLNKDELATEYKAKWDVEAGHQDYNTLATAIILGKRIKHVTPEDVQKYIDDTNAHLAEKVSNEEEQKQLELKEQEEEGKKHLTAAQAEIEEDKKGNEAKISETEHAIEAITELLPTLKGKDKKESEVALAKLTHELETVKMEHGGWVGKDVAFKSGTGFKNFVVKKYKGGIYELKGLGHSGEMFATEEELENRFAHQKMARGGTLDGSKEYEGYKYSVWHKVPYGYSVSGTEIETNIIFKGDDEYFDKPEDAERHAEILIQDYIDDHKKEKGGVLKNEDKKSKYKKGNIIKIDNDKGSVENLKSGKYEILGHDNGFYKMKNLSESKTATIKTWDLIIDKVGYEKNNPDYSIELIKGKENKVENDNELIIEILPLQKETDLPKSLKKLSKTIQKKIFDKINLLYDKRISAEERGKDAPQSYYSGVTSLEKLITKSLHEIGVKTEWTEGDDDTIIIGLK